MTRKDIIAIQYMREVDQGTPNACWVPCAYCDAGAVPFYAFDPAFEFEAA